MTSLKWVLGSKYYQMEQLHVPYSTLVPGEVAQYFYFHFHSKSFVSKLDIHLKTITNLPLIINIVKEDICVSLYALK